MRNIRKLKSGNYQVQIRLAGIKPITRSFPTKTLAIQFQREVEGSTKLQMALGKPVIEAVTFNKVADLFMTKYAGKDTALPGRLAWWCRYLGDTPMVSITEYIIDDALVELSEKITGSTVNRYKATISAVFIFFIRHPKYKRLGMSNPARKESVSTFPENPAKDRFLTDSEQEKLLKACCTSHWDKLYLLVLLALSTGARRGELLGLKWSDIDFTEKLARLYTTKNGKPRLLPLTSNVMLELMKFREIGNSLVFKNTVSPDRCYEIRKPWVKALKEADISDCRFHDLRHSAASNLAKNGASLLEIAEVLGHSSTTVTKRYAHLCIDHKRDLINRVMGNLGV